jgi:hypothetical protein
MSVNISTNLNERTYGNTFRRCQKVNFLQECVKGRTRIASGFAIIYVHYVNKQLCWHRGD